ncbi:MFS multidrug transporter [Purpureocillium lilacinum]|uniref:MFS multidrug transporter n=1 Tax=Purpureocillium lilacinum TaxID=33203 RepID=A0A179G2T3_PURLI|nr:MFS multidrug transporter [Purpureocillium lilacinum]
MGNGDARLPGNRHPGVPDLAASTEKRPTSDLPEKSPVENEKPPQSTTHEGLFQNAPGQDEESGGRTSEDSLAPSQSKQPQYTPDGKRIITEEECYDALGYSWPSWKKWMLLSSIFAVQMSMNFNTSVYPSAVEPLSEHFEVSEQAVRAGQCAFLVLYAFGCELWAPWSEEFGRWPILQCSLFLVNIWQILAALAPNFGSIIVARALGGLSSAGGSVTLGMVADLYQPEDQDWAVAFVVLSSVGGTSIGPIVGGPIKKFLPWHWNFWIQLIFGVTVQVVHFFMPESRATILMDREAKRRRKSGEDPNIYGPNEVKNPRISWEEVGVTWIRPFEMFLREPIVLSCSLLSGFSDALIFTFQEGFTPVFKQWGFGTLELAWAFIPIIIGYLIAYVSYFPWIIRDSRITKAKGPDYLPPEHRLKWLLYLAPMETIGLFGFAWTSLGPPQVHWIAPMIFSCLIAIANYGIYMSTISYMLAAYGPYSASATGGNGFARDLLAGIAALYSTPLYTNIAPNGLHLEYASTILACLAFVVTMPVYLIYWKGPWLREKSKFAQSLAADRKAKGGHRVAEATKEQLEPHNL